MERNTNILYEIIDNKVAVIRLPQVVVSGDEAMKFTETINNVLKQSPRAIVVDLQNVEFMNSIGLGMVASVHSKLTKIKIPYYIININEKVNNLFEITHLNQVLNLNSSLEEIIVQFSSK